MKYLLVLILFNADTNLIEVVNEATLYSTQDVCLETVYSRVELDLAGRIVAGQMIDDSEIIGYMCRPEVIEPVN